MHNFLEIFRQSGTYSAQIANHQAYLRREEKFIDPRLLSISDLQIYYLSFDYSVGNNERDFFLNKGAVTVDVHTQLKSV